MSEATWAQNNFRYERKFTIRGFDRELLLREIKDHPAFFQNIYHPRLVNNIYLDTEQLKFYHDNIEGISVRKKVRVRWYGALEHSGAATLEYKLKQNLHGDKWSFPLPESQLGRSINRQDLQRLFAGATLPEAIAEDLKLLRPTLLNNYRRTYFLSSDKKFRLTFDEALHFRAFVAGKAGTAYHQKNHFVVELKYDPQHDKEADKIARQFSFRLTKSSKYVSGIEFTR